MRVRRWSKNAIICVAISTFAAWYMFSMVFFANHMDEEKAVATVLNHAALDVILRKIDNVTNLQIKKLDQLSHKLDEIQSVLNENVDEEEHKEFGNNIILFWTAFYGLDDVDAKTWKYRRHGCCDDYVLTRDRTTLGSAAIVVFFFWDIRNDDLPESKGHDHQLWLMWSAESPDSYPSRNPHDLFIATKRFDALATYNRFSSIHCPFTHTFTVADDDAQHAKEGNSQEEEKEEHRKAELKATLLRRKNKTGLSMAFLVSHCKTTSKREILAKTIQSYGIRVDSIGKCGNMTNYCGSTNNCYEHIGNDYNFFLAAENALCEDYLSEKTFMAAKYDMLPIVYGGIDARDYDRVLPKDAVVNVDHFSSVRHLVDYIKDLNNNIDKMIDRHYQWKSRFRYEVMHFTMPQCWCRMCAAYERHRERPSTKFEQSLTVDEQIDALFKCRRPNDRFLFNESK